MPEPQVQCPVPDNEAERVRAVHAYDVLGSAPEVDFDALTRVAAHTFQTPVAVVGLMDSDRLWFKSRLGLDVPQLDRQIAFCAFAIMQPGEVLVVEDLQQDPRFKHNPLVTNPPHVRFYAGAPLVDPNGFALGTIAVVDTKPRTIDKAEEAVLQDMAILVMTALENRRRSLLLSKLALTDHLTGVANRAQFDRTLETEIAHAKRSEERFSVLCMDLDGFKEINDRYGHLIGDEVLCEVARRLREQLRTEDTVSRIGGDEFGIIIRDGTQESVDALSERITRAMDVPITFSSGDEIGVGISIGMATYSDATDSRYTLLAQADSALYQAKRRAGVHR
jgi:diguanylate cyclase (GGDEF)-like protein